MRRPSGTAIAVIVLLVALALPVLYVLSYGPSIYVCQYGWIDSDTGTVVYRCYWPLKKVMGYWPWFGQLVSWYLSFWETVSPLPSTPVVDPTAWWSTDPTAVLI